LNAVVTDEVGLADAEFTLRVRYEGGGRERDLLTSVRYNRESGCELEGYDMWDV
jgi:hypothetical protein